MKYKIFVFFTAINLLLLYSAHAQVYERTRHESKTFRVYDQTSLEVYNKYGNIHLFTWAKDSVKIEIDLTVKASKEAKADKIFEFIDFEFSDSKFYIIARTTLHQNSSSFWAELSDLANTVFSGNNKTQINYNIYLPSDMTLKLENKFGNIYCNDYKGKFTVSLSNGDFKANDLSGELNMDLNFSTATIHSIQKAELNASYLELSLDNARELNMVSKSSTLNIDKINVLNVNSRRDKFYINNLSSIIGETSFSYFTIKGIQKNVKLKSDYGEVKLKGLDPGFLLIDLESRYTDIILQIPDGLNCEVDMDMTESTYISYPDHYNGLVTKPVEKKDEKGSVKGYIGMKDKANSKVRVSITSGKVVFQDAIQLF